LTNLLELYDRKIRNLSAGSVSHAARPRPPITAARAPQNLSNIPLPLIPRERSIPGRQGGRNRGGSSGLAATTSEKLRLYTSAYYLLASTSVASEEA
jgi:hypothetical protein